MVSQSELDEPLVVTPTAGGGTSIENGIVGTSVAPRGLWEDFNLL